MNRANLEFCASPEWAEIVQNEVLPWALGDRDLGDDVLEVGAGLGLTTDVLRRTVAPSESGRGAGQQYLTEVS